MKTCFCDCYIVYILYMTYCGFFSVTVPLCTLQFPLADVVSTAEVTKPDPTVAVLQ